MIIQNFRWRNWEPEFVLRQNDETKAFPIMNQKISFGIGDRFCTGYMKSGKHHDCPAANRTDGSTQCRLCSSLDDNMPCVQCTGLCTNMSKRKKCMEETYFIYLAFFGGLSKVGISRQHRVKQRLVEQGADFGAIIAKIEDGRLARVYEQKMRRFLGITDRITGHEKHGQLRKDSGETIRKMEMHIEKLNSSKFRDILSEPEIFDLRKYYNILSVKSEFLPVKKIHELSGKVVSVKGSIMLLENGGHYCVNCHELVGRKISGF